MSTSRIETPAVEAARGASAEVFAQLRKSLGGVPNTFAAIGALNPDALRAVLAIEGVLATGTLGKKDLETIKLFVSADAGCDYCVAAHSMLGAMAGFSPDALRQIRAGESTDDIKRNALIRLVRILQRTSGTIDETEYEAIRFAGYTDAQLVEISLAIASITFTNVFNRINDTALDFAEAA